MPKYECKKCGRIIESRAAVRVVQCACGGDMVPPSDGRVINPRTLGRFAIAVTKWMAAGRPRRSAEQVAKLLTTFCDASPTPCQHFVGGHCKLCACPVNDREEPLKNKLAMATERCPVGKFEAAHKGDGAQWIGDAERLRAAIDLAGKIPGSVSAIAGVGRSGIAPAMILAERLHCHAYAIDESARLTIQPNGGRLDRDVLGPMLVVDDTIATGRSFGKLSACLTSKTMGREILTAVLFVAPGKEKLVDFYSQFLPLPHFLSWNFFNSVHTESVALDFDGVICHDPTPGEDKSDKSYRDFCLHARPKWLPRRNEIEVISTSRPERMRAATESWLRRHRVRFKSLSMALDETAYEDRGKHKAADFAASPARIFVESDPKQAVEIAHAVNKRVICPDSCEVWN